MDLIKWQLNGVECNFGPKSCLWFQIELALRVCRFWFQTKLHSSQFNYHNLARSIITLCPLLRCLLEIIPWWVRSLVLAHLTESSSAPFKFCSITHISFTVYYNFLSYRLYPSYEYAKKDFAHKGPLSRLVTTTHPSNPFNKVDKWNSRPKKLCKRAKQSKFV